MELLQRCAHAAQSLGYEADTATNKVIRCGQELRVPLSLEESKVDARFTGHGYNSAEALGYDVRNNSGARIEIRFPTGQIFVPSGHALTQNLVLKAELKITLEPGETQQGTAFSFCGNSNFACSAGGRAMEVSDFILHPDVVGGGQAVVWKLVNPSRTRGHGEPTLEEQACNEAFVQEVVKVVAGELGEEEAAHIVQDIKEANARGPSVSDRVLAANGIHFGLHILSVEDLGVLLQELGYEFAAAALAERHVTGSFVESMSEEEFVDILQQKDGSVKKYEAKAVFKALHRLHAEAQRSSVLAHETEAMPPPPSQALDEGSTESAAASEAVGGETPGLAAFLAAPDVQLPKLEQLLKDGAILDPRQFLAVDINDLKEIGVKKLQAKRLIETAQKLFG